MQRVQTPKGRLFRFAWALAVAGVLWGRALQAADPLAGDLDGDGSQTVLDLIRIVSLARTGALGASPQTFSQADINQDGVINDLDAALLGEVIVGKRQLGNLPLVRVHETSPAAAEAGVSATRETILYLTQPLAENAVVDINRLFANASGRRLLTRAEPARDRRSLTLFYLEPLPGNAQVRVTFDGTGLKDFLGRDLDLDGDGQAGGAFRLDFSTLSLTPVANSSVVGRVFASEMRPLAGGGTEVVNQPLPGVIITVDGREETLRATTDALGNFRLEPVPAGEFFVHIDGRAAPLSNWPNGAYYPFVGKKWYGVAGQSVNIGDVFLPLVIAGSLQPLKPDEETVVRFPDSVVAQNPALAGVSLTVPAGALFGENGGRGGKVGIAPVAPDRLPGPLPPGVNPALVITIQTDGNANFDRPVPACFPNLPDPVTGERLPAGAKSALWSFNHDTGRFEIVGPMTVSDDGTLVCTDPGVGILAPGWHFTRTGTQVRGLGTACDDGGATASREPGTQSRPPGKPKCTDCPPENGSTTTRSRAGDPVLLFSGELLLEVTDLRIAGRGFDFVWQRTYRSKTGPNTAQGNGWDFPYRVSLEAAGTDLVLHDGNGRDDIYRRGANGRWTAPEFFREISVETDGRLILLFEDRGQWIFHPLDGSAKAGKLAASVDRNGNRLGLAYDAAGRLATITDTLDRNIQLAYTPDGFLASVTDFAGRQVRYGYYGHNEAGGGLGDLKSVTSPAITGTPNGNDFPNGKITTYTYTTGFADDRLNHNLLTITDGRGNDPTDARFGQGPVVENSYSPVLDPADLNFDRVTRQIWGGGMLDFVYVPLLPAEPNGNAVLRTIVNDRVGNVSEHFFDARNRLVRLREFTGRAVANQPTNARENRPQNRLRAADPEFFETIYEWTEDSLERSVRHPNGNITEMVYESDLNPRADARDRGNRRVVRHLPGSHIPRGDQDVIEERFEYDSEFGGCCGFGFVTQETDGRGKVTRHEYDVRGNRVRTQFALARIVEEWEFNAFGQMTAHILPDNGSGHRRRDEWTYFDAGPQRGYLQSRVEDAGSLALTTRYEHDAVGNVVRIIDPRGYDEIYARNSLNQVVRAFSREVVAGVRYRTDSHFDANDNLIRQEVENRDAAGVVQPNASFTTTWEYDELDHPVRIRRELEEGRFAVIEHSYDRNRNLILTRKGEATAGRQPANVIARAYDERNLLFRVTLASGASEQATTEYTYDPNRNLVRIAVGLESSPRIWRHTYDGFNRQLTSTDPMGNRTVNRFDAASLLVGWQTEGELNDQPGEAGNVRLAAGSQVFDDLERLVRREMDYFDPATQAAIGDGKVLTTAEYADFGRVLRLTDDNGHARTWRYDHVGRLAETEDAAGNRVSLTYDPNGNVRETTETELAAPGATPEQFTTRTEHDALDRPIRIVSAAGYVREYGYDSRNNLTVYLDALRQSAASPGNRVEYGYDGLNRLVLMRRQLAEGGAGGGNSVGAIVTHQLWDDSSRLTAQVDGLGNRTTHLYDAVDRKVGTLHADGTREIVELDVHGNVVVSQDANGTVVRSQFDFLNRLARREIVPGAGVSAQTTFEAYAWDGLSRLVLGEDDRTRVQRFYDSLGRLTRELQNDGEVTFAYDGPGNEVSCRYPGGRTIGQSWDEIDRLTEITEGRNSLVHQSYAGPGRISWRDRANGTTTRWTYDADRRVAGLTHTQGATPLLEQTFAWDGANNRISQTESGAGGPASAQFVFDSAYRLIGSRNREGNNPVQPVDYELDAAGNRRQVTGGNAAGAYVLEPGVPGGASVNQYRSTPLGNESHDANGNVTEIRAAENDRQSFAYDFRNRLVRIESQPGAVVSAYQYDVLGRRVQRTVAGQVTRHFFKHWQEIEEQDAAGNTLATHVRANGIDELLTSRQAGRDLWHHADDLASVRLLTDSAGQVLERYRYDDFGVVTVSNPAGAELPGSALGNPWLFTGRRLDPESGLYDFRNRFLDPWTGRFLSRDPLGAWGDPDNLGNAFSYAGNRPGSSVDPFGLDREITIGPHSFIKVDTYDANGKKNGQTSLHYMPAGLWGESGTDWRLNRPHQDDWHNKHLNFSVKITSSKAEDEALLAYWRSQSRDPNSKRWNVAQNCWWSAFKHYDVGIARNEHWLARRLKTLLGPFNNLAMDRIFGIERDPNYDPSKTYIAPEPDQGWIESGRRAADNLLKGAEGVAQKVIDFFDNPKPALQGLADSISSWFSSPPSPPPAPRPTAPTADIAPITGSTRTSR